jgi:hypothetical protein
MFRSTVVVALMALGFFTPSLAEAADELSTSNRLDDRRFVTSGDRAFSMGFESGQFDAQGWHLTGEMGGVWTQPLKLVDGYWFGIDDQWVKPAVRFTSGWGYVRMDLPTTSGLKLRRTDFVPDGTRGVLTRLELTNPGAERRITLKVDAHSELLSHYPWASTTPNAGGFNLPDRGSFDGDALTFRETGKPHPNAPAHDWAALVGSTHRPQAGETGPGHWGAQEPPEPCTESVDQHTCDEGPFGQGTGGQLRYRLTLPPRSTRTFWLAVAGSDEGLEAARGELRRALKDPDGALAAKHAARERWSRYTRLSLPGDPMLARGIDWGKQNLLDLTLSATNLRIRDVDGGKQYPPPAGTLDRARWVGAGFPDYTWLFATDGEYTAFANVSVGQFESIKDHARALQRISQILNGDSGKVVHEVVEDGSVYFGSLKHRGNTDETAKFPSLVALIWRWTGDNGFRDEMYAFSKRNMEYVYEQFDKDGDGWPEGLGNVERAGMGEEKLDNSVYTIRGLFDLADMARSKGDTATAAWALDRANDLASRFEASWWMPEHALYADSLEDLGNVTLQQKHWIGQTPMEVELTRDERAWPGLALQPNGSTALQTRETDCYSGERPYNLGLFHTGCAGGPEGKGERTIFSLNTAIQAVGEGNYGRLGATQQQRYTDANVEPMFSEPWTNGTPDEQPGALPEILPSPDNDAAGTRDANIDRCTRCRSMVMQAWGHYGTMWPAVHQHLGVRPDMGRRRLEVVPQLPSSAPIAGRNIRLGSGALALVQASRDGDRYRTRVATGSARVETLLVGHTLPRGSRAAFVTLDGKPVKWEERETNRGNEVTVKTSPGDHTLEVRAG